MSSPFDKLKSSLNDLIFEDATNEEENIHEREQEQVQVERSREEPSFESHFATENHFATESRFAAEDHFTDEKPFKEPEENISMLFDDDKVIEGEGGDEEPIPTPVAEIKPIQTSIITEGTLLTGSIRTESHVKVEGTIQGNVDTTANVTIVGGEVIGDIRGGMIGTKMATVKGNITSSDIVEILEESYIEGNIFGDKIYIAGRIIGNINSTGMLTISSEAIVEGDILTKRLRVEEGSVINGRITMNR